jgi:soluble lytic murein transglycosylase-like protein
MKLTVAMFAMGLALCLTECAHAGAASRALAALCPKAVGLAPQIEANARRNLLHPALLTALIAHESRCRVNARSGRGDYGLGQIRVGGSAAKGATAQDLLNPERNLELAARHLAWAMVLCGGTTGLSVYSGRARCRASKYQREVLRKFSLAFAR